ncbi:MAG TPA: hypothetical protein VGH28_29880 [Polyangiaceae bacterium]|jgi:hypothetical protein
MRLLRHLLVALLVVLTFAVNAAADPVVPGSALQLAIVSRAHLSFSVAVTNPTDAPATFDGTGLYFVPLAKEDEPQRLGVVTPGRFASTPNAAEAWGGISVPAHATVQIALTSYCLDNHRSSPQETTQYRLADARLPATLSTALATAARSIATTGSEPKETVQRTMPVRSSWTNPRTQSAVWRIRAEIPTPLIGD